MKFIVEKMNGDIEKNSRLFQLSIDNCSKVTVDFPPRRRTIIFNSHVGGDESHHYADKYLHLSFPRMRFEIVFCESDGLNFPLAIHCGFLDELGNLCFPYLPNVMANLRVYLSFNGGYQSVEKMMDTVMDFFWQTQFNYDATDTVRKYVNLTPNEHPERSHIGRKKISDFFNNWQMQTKYDPKWVPNEFIQLTSVDGYPGRQTRSIVPIFPRT